MYYKKVVSKMENDSINDPIIPKINIIVIKAVLNASTNIGLPHLPFNIVRVYESLC